MVSMLMVLEKNAHSGYFLFVMLIAVLLPFIPGPYVAALFFAITLILAIGPHKNIVPAFSLWGFSFAIFIMSFLSVILGYTDYEFPAYILGASIFITAAGSLGAVSVRNRGVRKPRLDSKFISATSSIALILFGALSACAAAYWITAWMNIPISLSQLFFLTLIGGVTCALLESIPSRADKYLTLMMGTGMVMWLFASFGYYVNFSHLSATFIFSLFLAYLAYRMDIADVSAMLAATLLGVLIIVFTNLNWYLILIMFFLLGGAFTKYQYNYKVMRGIAQGKGGVRSYENVLSNSITALILAVVYGVYHELYPALAPVLLFAYLGAVATATGDTLASEIGETNRGKPILITTLKPVKPGTDGGVTRLGEAVCIGGSVVIGVLALVLGVIDIHPGSAVTYVVWLLVVVLGGFGGTNFDSLLGATLQQKGWLSNSGVNLIATMGGAFISGAAYYVLCGHVV
ncbi:MAG: TIGR00297 family protein [ANME-2 cluster archaeon]|nr:TIGR00297 family protein [ANME-2 cluster archaeon]